MARIGDLEVHFRPKAGGQQIDNTAIAAVVNGPGVRRDLRRRARNVQTVAKGLVGVRTGRLRDSIRVDEQGHGRGQAAAVAVIAGRPGLSYTWLHHEGAAPHRITARGSNMLRFVSGGQVMYRRTVNHPGSRGTRYLINATRAWAP